MKWVMFFGLGTLWYSSGVAIKSPSCECSYIGKIANYLYKNLTECDDVPLENDYGP